MATLLDLVSDLESVGVPVVYYAFPEGEAPALPFICYLVTGTDNFSADGSVYQKVNAVSVELYTKEKDFTLQNTLESALSNYFWQIEGETYLDSEKCFEIIYTLEV